MINVYYFQTFGIKGHQSLSGTQEATKENCATPAVTDCATLAVTDCATPAGTMLRAVCFSFNKFHMFKANGSILIIILNMAGDTILSLE